MAVENEPLEFHHCGCHAHGRISLRRSRIEAKFSLPDSPGIWLNNIDLIPPAAFV